MFGQLSGIKILPAIDLIENRVVRLKHGSFAEIVQYEEDPLELAQQYHRLGAEFLHVVDLDGARAGRPLQSSLIKQLAIYSGLKVQVGGGLRSLADMENYLRVGVERVVIGSLAVSDPVKTRSIISELGANRITLAFDLKEDAEGILRPAMNAWLNLATLTLENLLEEYRAFPEVEYLCTDISRDGCLQGIDRHFYEKIIAIAPWAKVIVSGGVSTVEDVLLTKDLGLHGLVLGKALHERRLTIEEVLAC